MSELGELVAVMVMKTEEEKCPWNQPEGEDVGIEPENAEFDDTDAAKRVQANNGGVLGTNLQEGKPGAADTINGIYPPPSREDKRVDTRRTNGLEKVIVPADGKSYKYTVAAHHLIPGKASLATSQICNYMEQGKEVTSKDGAYTWKMRKNIGYNVNGSHNGIWLPGNYSIRKRSSPKKGVSWSGLDAAGMGDWCISYIAALCRKKRREFHDTHTDYNENVKDQLDKIHTALLNHQVGCEECQKKNGQEILPPYRLKDRLYQISKCLHGMLSGSWRSWNRAYLTSDRLRAILSDPVSRQKFQNA